MSETDRIRSLNDSLRKSFRGGKVMMTRGVLSRVRMTAKDQSAHRRNSQGEFRFRCSCRSFRTPSTRRLDRSGAGKSSGSSFVCRPRPRPGFDPTPQKRRRAIRSPSDS